MNELSLVKKLNETYLYNVTDDYMKRMTKAVIESERFVMSSESFAQVRFDVNRRQTNPVVSRVLVNPDVVFIKPSISLPRALKVFTVKDIKDPKKPLKVFIDISELLVTKDGQYAIHNTDRLIAYLTSAMVQLIYNAEPMRIIGNTQMMYNARNAFCQMVTYIIDYLYKISNTDISKDMCKHLAAMYFDVNILKKDIDKSIDSIHDAATKISKLNNRQIDILSIYIDETTFTSIKSFIETLAKILKLSNLTLDVFLNKWIYIYGAGTQFGLEYFPAFSDILTNVYCISYINNQKTIEKVIGSDMSNYSGRVIGLGGGLM